MDFIKNTFLFHLWRKDLQHNFSPYFYILRFTDKLQFGSVLNKLLFVPQLIVVALLGLCLHENLAVACFLQTFAFVTFNKVCTSQVVTAFIQSLKIC